MSPGNRGASFATVGDGPHSFVLRGRHSGGEIALKIQKEIGPEPNEATTARWLREYEALVRFGGDEPGLVGLASVPGFDADAGPPVFEPLVLCRERGILFNLPCPRCLRVHVLGDCRDDKVLSEMGLPAWSTSDKRFVWCTACGREDPVFYSRKGYQGRGPVKDFVSLLLDLRQVVDRGADSDPVASELLAGLEAEFPCHACEQRAGCYPRDPETQGLAESRLVPLVLNDFFAWPLPLLKLRIDEAADLLSGAPPAVVAKMHAKSWPTPAMRRMKQEGLERVVPASPVEAAAARLDLFVQAVRAVERLHAKSGRPHLGLSPAHFLVHAEADSRPVVRLIAPDSPSQRGGLCQPPLALTAPFAAPALLLPTFGKPLSVRIHIEKVWAGPKETFFATSVQGEGLPIDKLDERDEVVLTLKIDGWEKTEISANILNTESVGQIRRVSLATKPAALDPIQVNDLKAAKGGAPQFGTVTFYRDFGTPFDVYALGMLLFRVLLVNDAQSWERVQSELIEPMTSSLEMMAATRPGSSGADYLELVGQEFTRPPYDRLASPRNAWHRPTAVGDVTGIPEEAWIRLLTVGIRAITHIPGFSYCESDRGTSGSDPSEPTTRMLADLEEIEEALATALREAAPALAVETAHPIGMEDYDVEDDVVSVSPLTAAQVHEISSEVTSELEEQMGELRSRLLKSEKSLETLHALWNELFVGVVGREDPQGAPTAPDDDRIQLLATTATESIECITQVFQGIAHFAGDDMGTSVPKIRVFIQDALFDTEGAPDKKLKKIQRQLRALRMFLYAVVQMFVDANNHSTKIGTASLLRLMEKGLFAPDVKGKKERPPDAAEIQRRFTQLAESIPGKHQRIFQPFFQEFVKKKLSSLK